jgi:ABC-type spermidine/putrescine transport system permease subunit II
MTHSRGRLLVVVLAAVVVVFLIAPILIVFPLSLSSGRYLEFPPPGLSLRWIENFLSSREWTSATLTSVTVALGATVLATTTGTAAAIALVRGHPRVAAILGTVFLLPLVVPVIVLAVGLYYVFAQLQLIGSVPGLILAHALLGLPFVIVNVAVRLRGFDFAQELAARGLGASPVRAFLTVTLPQIVPGVLAGAFFAFLTSWDEVVIALFLVGTSAVTLPVQMFRGIRFEVDPTNAAVAALLVTVVVVGAGAYQVILRVRRTD